MNDVDKYGEFTEAMWFSGNGKEDADLAIMSLGLSGETGEVMEHVKKLFRDKHLDKEELKKELGDVVFYWARIVRFFGFLPSDILSANIAKLESRRERGTQRGDGDNR